MKGRARIEKRLARHVVSVMVPAIFSHAMCGVLQASAVIASHNTLQRALNTCSGN